MIDTAYDFGVELKRDELNRGVWYGSKKIGFIGIAIKRGITYHGLAFNINNDLTPFSWINPCGLHNVEITSLSNILDIKIDIKISKRLIIQKFVKHFNLDVIEIKNILSKDITHENCDNTKKKTLWAKKRLPNTSHFGKTKSFLDNRKLYTVCEEAGCPNRWECFSKHTATFLIMGPYCTRNCKFCSVKNRRPIALRNEEIEGIVEFTKKMNLSYVVITSVTRDDLQDGGASYFALLVKRLKEELNDIKVELLIPDFKGDISALEVVIKSGPNVLNHNIETVKRLYDSIRPGANYQRSLDILKISKELDPNLPTKSGIMVGLGETLDELVETLIDLKKAQVDIVTIGQYLRPTKNQIEVKKYYTPEEFEKLKAIGEEIGLKFVLSGVFVTSSYGAYEIFN